MKVEITKCYLVQLFDDDGNEIDYQYVFDNKKGAEKAGKQMVHSEMTKRIREKCKQSDKE